MARDFTIVSGFETGLTISLFFFLASEIGEHPLACAPWTEKGCSPRMPILMNSL